MRCGGNVTWREGGREGGREGAPERSRGASRLFRLVADPVMSRCASPANRRAFLALCFALPKPLFLGGILTARWAIEMQKNKISCYQQNGRMQLVFIEINT